MSIVLILRRGENLEGINRLFLGAFNTKVFDDILQEEHDKLMQMVSKMEKKLNTENISRKYDLKEKYHLPYSG